MTSKKINISDEENFKFFFVLFQRLFTQFFSNGDLKDKSGQVTFEEFLDKNPAITFNKFSGEIAAKSVEEVNSLFGDLEEKDKKNKRIGASTIEEIVIKLSGRAVVHDSKLGKNNYEEIKLDALSRLLGHESWKVFTDDSQVKTAAKEIPKPQLDKINAIRRTKKPKVLISITAHSSNTHISQFKQEIKNDFRWRLAQSELEDRIELEFDETEAGIGNESEANERAEKKKADLILWGHFGNQQNGVWAKLDCLVSRPQLSRRIVGNRQSYDLMKLSMIHLRYGKVYQKIDHLILLILGISALIEDDAEAAKEYVNKIPVKDRCDETIFVLGNCNYITGDHVKGLELWQMAIEKNPKHLRAKINVARHQVSLMLRKGSLSEETIHNVKESLTEYDPKDATNEESALIGVLFAELGETKKAIKALEVALKGSKKLEGAFYYHIKLGQLKSSSGTSAAEEYVKAALATEQPELQELCLRLIADCHLSDVDEKRRLLAKIRDNSKVNGERRRMNIEDWLSKNGKDTSGFTDFIVYEVSGHLRKNQSKELLKNGDGLNFDDWVLAENNAAKAVLLKCNNQGVASPIKRLYLKPGSAKKVEETLYEYAQPLRSSDSDDEILLMCSRELNHGKISGSERIKVVCQEIGLDLNLTFDDVGRLMLDRRMFDPFSGQMARKFTPIEIQQGSKTGVFTTIRKLRLLIPDDDEVGERVDRFSELIDISDNKYYAQLAGYLSDFYAPADETDIKLWSVARQLSWME